MFRQFSRPREREREDRARKSEDASSPVAATQIDEVRKRIIMIDDEDLSLNAAPRATVTYATYNVLSLSPSLFLFVHYLTFESPTRLARFPYHRCRNSNSPSLIKIKETSRELIYTPLDRVTQGRAKLVSVRACFFGGYCGPGYDGAHGPATFILPAAAQ